MNGAESLLTTLVDAGVEVCFTNPGTSEMHLVAALDKTERMRAVLTLFEGVATGAADGYGRMADKPATTLLHLGAGLSNGLANLHNARRAHTPIVNIVGQHAGHHIHFDAPLTADIEGLARPVSAWVRTARDARTVARDGIDAVAAAFGPPGGIATLITPADAMWDDGATRAAVPPRPEPRPFSSDAIDQAADALKHARRAVVLIGGHGLRARGLEAAGRVAAASGAALMCDTFYARLERGAGRVPIRRLPYFPEEVRERLRDVDTIILAGAEPLVSFFAYPGQQSSLMPEGCNTRLLASPGEDIAGALAALADALNAQANPALVQAADRPALPQGALDTKKIGAAIGALLPEGAIISDESTTSGGPTYVLTTGAPPFDHLTLTGGSIGQGMPLAVGAAIACPGRKVVCLHGDGGAMYTLQALWTMAREQLDITTVVFANRAYQILSVELMRVGINKAGAKAASLFDLSNPTIDWVGLAKALGVEAVRAEDAADFADKFGAAMRTKGPRLIEAPI